ncbi:hypothetical protein FGB62_174g010 [Gracilaria domingensis]|nr:hypothetical protein FGB62_174g010 [Gracilaria domingensis]
MIFPAREDGLMAIGDARLATATDRFPDPLLYCEQERCVVFHTISTPPNVSGSTTVRFSDVIYEEDLQYRWEEVIPLLDTSLTFTADARRLFPQLASRFLVAIDEGINDPIELRRRVFLGSRTGECVFNLRREATSVPLPFLLAALGAWGLSALLGVLGFWLRASVQYDVSDPMHWATKTVRRDGNDAQDGGEPFVEGVWDNGHCVVYLSTSQVQKQSTLGRLKRYLTAGAFERSIGDVSSHHHPSVTGRVEAGP